MVTLVGTQKNFEDALYQLCELDYDAVEAYKAAIDRLEDPKFKEKLDEFKADHQRHITEIKNLLHKHKHKVPTGPSAKEILTKGKVVIANIFGDHAILTAMLTNEIDTNTAYEKLTKHPAKWADAEDILVNGLNDERKHKAWLEKTLK